MEKKHHIQCGPGEIGEYVLLPGDPGRVKMIAEYLNTPQKVAENREYVTYTGSLLGQQVSVTSTGIGAPSTAIAIEELSELGAHTFIRVGGGGSLQDYVKVGQLVIPTGAIRDEGTTRQIIPLAYPAVADFQVVGALADAATQLGYSYHLGVVHTKDSLTSEIAPETLPNRRFLEAEWHAWLAGKALASEMEAAAIFVLASVKRLRAGAVLKVRDERLNPAKGFDNSMEDCISTAIKAVENLIRTDKRAI